MTNSIDITRIGTKVLIPYWDFQNGWSEDLALSAEGLVIGAGIKYETECLEILITAGSRSHTKGIAYHFGIKDWGDRLKFIKRMDLQDFLDTLNDYCIPFAQVHTGHELVSMFVDD